MSNEERRNLTRRQALTLAGGLGAGAVVAGSGVLGKFGEGSDETIGPELADAASCVLTPSMTEGPYFVDELLERSDVRGGQVGVPLELTINVFSADENCQPYSGAIVDVWQCNAQGAYSDISAGGNGNTVGETWLRGLQTTDSQGRVKFTTIFPGWYPGRTIHVHMKVRTFSGTTTTYNFNTQLFFDESVTAQVLGEVPAYARSQSRGTTNANDGIFESEMVVPLTGTIAEGYSGTIDIGLSGLPDEGTTDVPDTETQVDESVAAGVTSVRLVARRDGSRGLVLAVRNREVVKVDARLLRGGRLLARRRTGRLKSGRHALRMKIGRGHSAGRAVLKVVMTDAAGNRKVVQRQVKIPAPRG